MILAASLGAAGFALAFGAAQRRGGQRKRRKGFAAGNAAFGGFRGRAKRNEPIVFVRLGKKRATQEQCQEPTGPRPQGVAEAKIN